MYNDFLNFKLYKVQTRELTERSFQNNRRTTEFSIGHLGKPTVVEALRPDDFLRVRQELAKSRGAVSLGNGIGRITMDGDGAIKLIRAVQQNGIKRYVMVSAMNAEEPQGVTKRSRPTCVPSLRLARRCGRACWNTRSFAQGH